MSSDVVFLSSDLVVSCPPEEDRTRQEFYHDSLVSTILQRSGVPQGVPFLAADVDFDIDLTAAYGATARAQEAFLSLPADVVERFRSFDRLVAAMAAGEVSLTAPGEPVSGEPAAVPASVSAPVPSPSVSS